MLGLSSIGEKFVAKLSAWFRASELGTLHMTGILGLALIVIGYFHFKGPSSNEHGNSQRGQTATGARSPRIPQPANVGAIPPRRATPLAGPVLAKMQGIGKGIGKVSISCPGVLLQQWQPHQIVEEGAEIRPEVAVLIKEMCLVSNVYLVR
jgi:hypothetical protein